MTDLLQPCVRALTDNRLLVAMRRSNWAWAILVAVVLPTLVDASLGFRSPLAAQAVNATLPLAVMLLAWGLSGRVWAALGCEAVLLGGLRYADHIKLTYLNSGLVYAVFAALPGLLREPRLILGFIRPTTREALGMGVALFLLAMAAWWFRRRRQAGPWFRGGCVVVSVALLAIMGSVRIPDTVPDLGWSVWTQRIGAKSVGVAGNIVLGRMTSHNATRAADPIAERAFWNEPSVRQALSRMSVDDAGRRPDIVILQSESLFEPSELRGFADTPVLQRVAQGLGEPGRLRVPVFGGRTLQTEFEVLTGAPVAFYPGSMFAYFELMGRHSIDALPRVLADQGYATVLVHPNDRGFWNRGTVMPEMGFATFQDIGSFLHPRDYSDRSYVSDMALTHAVLAELDASNRPMFVTAISIENHGPWGQYPPADEHGLGLPSGLHGEPRKQLAEYVQHAMAADRAYGYLIDALERRGRPTIVLIYGDHLPALAGVYQQIGFKDGKPAEEHDPPYRVWANFPVPKPPAVTSAYLLQGWLLHASGLPLKGHELANYLAGLVAADASLPVADRQRVLDEYANIAAANVATSVRPRGVNAGTIFMGHDHLASIVHRLTAPKDRKATDMPDGDDLRMQPVPGYPAQLDFDVDYGVASISLRPYLAPQCRPTSGVAPRFTVTGDGRVLYQATLPVGALRLATLDLRGIRRLSLQADGPSDPTCDGMHVRVAQLLCYSANCSEAGPTHPPAVALRPSRILAPGDTSASPSKTSK